MQKLLTTLEKNVEWIALSLAGLWVLWMVWAYAISTPVFTMVANQKVTPATVDSFVSHSAQTLDQQIGSSQVPDMQVVDYMPVFLKSMQAVMPTAVATVPMQSPPPFRPLDAPVVVNDAAGVKVTRLPIAPPPLVLESRTGQSTVIAEPAPGAPAAAPAAGGVQPVDKLDKTWVTTFASFNQKTLELELQKANIPAELTRQTLYIVLEQMRREVDAAGNPIGPDVVVPALAKNVPPVDRKANPAQFLLWAAQPTSQVNILEPLFYRVVSGKAWQPLNQPAAVNPAVNPVPVAFDPAALVTKWKTLKTQKEKGDFNLAQQKALSPVEYGQLQKAIRDDAEKSKPVPQPRGNRPTPPPGGRSGRGMGSYDAQDPAVMGEMYAAAWKMMPGNKQLNEFDNNSGTVFNPDTAPKGFEAPPPVPGVPEAFQPPAQLVPDANGDIPIWAHDETAEPGHTYKYRLRVIVKNPVYDQPNLADAKLAGQLELDGEWSAWSKPVTVPSNIKFWLASGGVPNRPEVKFNVARWQNGQNNVSPNPFTVAPGDMIGGPMTVAGGQVIDYTTGWTVVDVRQIGNDTRVTLLNADGRMETRHLTTDRANPEFKDLQATGNANLLGMAGGR